MLKRFRRAAELNEAVMCVAGGTYELFAGRDASRGLATMSMTVSDTYDPLDDLSQSEREKLAHWDKQFSGRHAARPLNKFTEALGLRRLACCHESNINQ